MRTKFAGARRSILSFDLVPTVLTAAALLFAPSIVRAQEPSAPPTQQAPPPQPGLPTQQVPSAQAPQAPTAPGQAAAPNQDPNIPDTSQNFLTPFDYDPRGRRDPFQPPVDEKPIEQGAIHGPFLPLQKFDLTQIKLSAIIWDVSHPKAMLTDPDGKVYIVGPNTKIGKNNGYIAVIREGEMIVVETTEENGRLLSATRILRLAPAGTAK